MSDIRDSIKVLEEKQTPLECVNEIVECLDALYTEELSYGLKKLPEDLSKYSGYISIAYKQAKLLQSKLRQV